jgi:cell division protein FtsW (lipid II flippase)
MLEYAGSQSRGVTRRRDEGAALTGVLRSLDWLLIAGVAGLIAVGLWAISGVTRFDIAGSPSYYLKRQIAYVCVGAVALAIGLVIDTDVYRRLWRPIFYSTVGLIAIVLLIGRAARGSTRWINVGFFTFQPSSGSSCSCSRSPASSPSARATRATRPSRSASSASA